MISLRKPSPAAITQFLREQHSAPLSYNFANLSREIPSCHTPPGFVFDHRREPIGSGAVAWERAKLAIHEWVMFQNGWTHLHAPQGRPRAGHVVGMLVWICGLWWLNPCRVLYEIDETTSSGMKRFGFGYGTLPAHVERGEERFLVEQDSAGNVFYDLAAFSHPRNPLVRLFSPLARRIQLRFGRDSMAAMRQFAENGNKST